MKPTAVVVLLVAVLALLPRWLRAAEKYELRSFKRIVLTTDFHAEGSGWGDFNKDGQGDAVYGPYWYEGPDFQKKHAIYPVKAFDPKSYSNNFITMVHDLNADGYDDVLVNEWPGKAVHWYQNPKGKDQPWKKHVAHPAVDNEAPQFGDITGDGRPELVFHNRGRLGYAKPGKEITKPWPFFAVSGKGRWHRYTHGSGFGDVNGDGKPDFLMAGGWWEQPNTKQPAEPNKVVLWKKHPVAFGKGGGQMHTYDVDGDGDRDVITSLVAHHYGLAWFEQVKKDDKITFVQHDIMGSKPEHNAYGVKFSQMHAVCLIDIDGDGLKDIVTGKRFWAHGPNTDSEPGAPAVLYWFKLVREKDGVVHYIPHQIDDNSGVGTQFTVGDLNGDKRPDIVTGNKKGGYVFLQEVKEVGKEEWEKAQPKRRASK